MTPLARISLLCEQEELYTKQEIVSAILKIVAEGMLGVAQQAVGCDIRDALIAAKCTSRDGTFVLAPMADVLRALALPSTNCGGGK